ncbi:hypothetical protein OE88DRAFT_1650349 [Heliocybe sulcata]|uniref:Uncharacterized protein n=1 Tax=Heliocybe sulcata TaxID=5364 RepID=A0A5C3NHI8_9AGAM|nr:hypothetical protein OE88DRAFT_1650349 [Heliocybe sulcata]
MAVITLVNPKRFDRSDVNQCSYSTFNVERSAPIPSIVLSLRRCIVIFMCLASGSGIAPVPDGQQMGYIHAVNPTVTLTLSHHR